jgi:probable phosphoglycerate mutase
LALTTFHLVRHGAHDFVGRVLAGRAVDAALNEDGRREAQALARRLAAEPVSRVVSSPRRRARETAAPIADALRRDMEIAPELDEHDCGAWAGESFETLAADPRWRAWNARRGTARPPSGESMAELQARIVGFLHALRRRHPGETLVLVSHAEPIRAALMYARGVALDDFLVIEVPIGSLSSIDIGGTPDRIATPAQRSAA